MIVNVTSVVQKKEKDRGQKCKLKFYNLFVWKLPTSILQKEQVYSSSLFSLAPEQKNPYC